MSVSDSYLIITTRQLPIPRVAKAETNCACPTEELSRPDFNGLFAKTARYALPTLHTQGLASNFYLAFAPLGSGDVAVFNQPVLDLLGKFSQPAPLTEGIRLAGNPPEGRPTAKRLVELGLLVQADAHTQPARLRSQTLTAWLHVTNDCNLACPYCYVHKTSDRMSLEQGKRSIDAIFRSATANGFRRVKLKYAGGEASLNFQLVLVLHQHAQQLAGRHGLELESVLLSNGVAIGQGMIREMQAHGIRLMISLDGVNEHHDAQRPFVNGQGSFRYVERTLDRLASHGFTPSISITISRRNLAGLPAAVDYVLRRDLPFSLNFYRENDCSTSVSDLLYADEPLIAAMKAAFAVIEANLPPYSLMDRLLDLTRLNSPHDHTCGLGDTYLAINHRGGVAKCHMDLEHAVTDVAAPDPLTIVRTAPSGIQNLSVEEKDGCRDCLWRNQCAGGCPALTYRSSGRFDVKSPNCLIYKMLLPEVLRLEGLRLLKYGLPSATLPPM